MSDDNMQIDTPQPTSLDTQKIEELNAALADNMIFKFSVDALRLGSPELVPGGIRGGVKEIMKAYGMEPPKIQALLDTHLSSNKLMNSPDLRKSLIKYLQERNYEEIINLGASAHST